LYRQASQQAVVDWKPHSDGTGAIAWLRSRNPHVTFVVGALIGSFFIGTSAWLMGGYTISVPSFGQTQGASTAPRYAPLNLAEQSSPITKSKPGPVVMRTEQTAHIVAGEEVVELQVGQRARLAVRIDDAEELKPETVALVSGLPEDVQLSDGIRINPQLWMLRATLLSSVELEAARGLVGRYPLTLELRTPEGHVISSAKIALEIVAAREDEPAVTSSTAAIVEDRKETEPTPLAQVRPVPAKSQSVRVAPDTSRRIKTREQSSKRIVVKRPEPIASPKPAQKARSVRPNTTASVPPVVAQGPQSQPQQKLVWPGDNPRAVYTQNPPFFLGGAVPNTAQQLQPAPVQNENWHQRIFQTPGH
jgi:hypothetical protein